MDSQPAGLAALTVTGMIPPPGGRLTAFDTPSACVLHPSRMINITENDLIKRKMSGNALLIGLN